MPLDRLQQFNGQHTLGARRRRRDQAPPGRAGKSTLGCRWRAAPTPTSCGPSTPWATRWRTLPRESMMGADLPAPELRWTRRDAIEAPHGVSWPHCAVDSSSDQDGRRPHVRAAAAGLLPGRPSFQLPATLVPVSSTANRGALRADDHEGRARSSPASYTHLAQRRLPGPPSAPQGPYRSSST